MSLEGGSEFSELDLLVGEKAGELLDFNQRVSAELLRERATEGLFQRGLALTESDGFSGLVLMPRRNNVELGLRRTVPYEFASEKDVELDLEAHFKSSDYSTSEGSLEHGSQSLIRLRGTVQPETGRIDNEYFSYPVVIESGERMDFLLGAVDQAMELMEEDKRTRRSHR